MNMISYAAIQEKSMSMNVEVRSERRVEDFKKVGCKHCEWAACLRCRLAAAV